MPATAQQASLSDWAERKTEELRGQPDGTSSADEHWRFNEPVLIEPVRKVVLKPNAQQAMLIEQTLGLYETLIGDDSLGSLVWSGLESGNPLTRDENYRWNSLADQGMFDAERRQRFIEGLEELGIRNVRVGLSNHLIDIDNEESWSDHDALIRDISDAGLNISLDLHHFGIEDRFRVVDGDGRTVGPQSYYLHPEWPDHFADFAAQAFDRYSTQVQAVTLINEPETTIGFNSVRCRMARFQAGAARNTISTTLSAGSKSRRPQ